MSKINNRVEEKKQDYSNTVYIITTIATALTVTGAVLAVSALAYEFFVVLQEFISEKFDRSDIEKLKAKAREFLPAELVAIVEKMEAINTRSILKRMALTNEEERAILHDIMNRFEVS